MYYDRYSRGSKAYMALAGEIIRREEKLAASTEPAVQMQERSAVQVGSEEASQPSSESLSQALTTSVPGSSTPPEPRLLTGSDSPSAPEGDPRATGEAGPGDQLMPVPVGAGGRPLW